VERYHQAIKKYVKEDNIQKIKPVSDQTQLKSIYFIELHVSTYFRPSSGSELVFKAY
jgi:hypothetical protein